MAEKVNLHLVLFNGDYDTFVALTERVGLGYWASLAALCLATLAILGNKGKREKENE